MPPFAAKFQGDEHPAIGKIDSLMQGVVLDLTIMQRAAPADMAKRRAKIRASLVEIAERVMSLADELSR